MSKHCIFQKQTFILESQNGSRISYFKSNIFSDNNTQNEYKYII